jgi:hypothetical protein
MGTSTICTIQITCIVSAKRGQVPHVPLLHAPSNKVFGAKRGQVPHVPLLHATSNKIVGAKRGHVLNY